MAAARPTLKPGKLGNNGQREDPPDGVAGQESLLHPPHRAWQRRLWRLLLTWRYRLFQRRRHRQLAIERVDGVPILVLPDVFNPALFRTGAALARYLQGLALSPNTTVLDLGTGSGISALVAALQGTRVVATDISPEAVRCARINALLNELEGLIDVREGDLFEPVRGERFDLVLFNPPYFPGRPRNAWEHAWRSDNVLARFAAGLGKVLNPDGHALIILSTDTDVVAATETLTRAGLCWRVAWQRDLINERLVILDVAMACPTEGSS